MSASLDTSVRSASTGTPAADSSATVASSASCWISPITTFIPSAPQRSANAFPIPLPAPVTTAVLPANSSTKRLLYLYLRLGNDPHQRPWRLQPPQRVWRVRQRHPLADQPLHRHPPAREVPHGFPVGLVGERARADQVVPLAQHPEQRHRRDLRRQRHFDAGAARLEHRHRLAE